MSSVSFAPPDSSAPALAPAASRTAALQLAALVGVLAWAYLPMLRVFADKWLNDPQYSHGLLVPFFSAFLMWRAWKSESLVLKPLPILGCGLLVGILAMRAAAGALLFHQLDAASLLLALVGGQPRGRRGAAAEAHRAGDRVPRVHDPAALRTRTQRRRSR